MTLVSRFVREQRRYTKDELKDIFRYENDDYGIQQFIKNLKAYGVLKSVKKNSEHLELSDLTDDDFEITDGSEISGKCYYVFSFVGIITYRDRIIKAYPKYMLTDCDDDTLTLRMHRVIKVLEKYNNSRDQIINQYNGYGEDEGYNTLSVMLFLLRDYFDNGIYSNSESITEINGEGDILWDRTIDESFCIISDGRPYYTDIYTKKTVDDNTDYFKNLHKYIITDCSRQLREAQLDQLFGLETELLSPFVLSDFGGLEYIKSRIHDELNIQFNTRKQILLKTIDAYLDHNEKLLKDNFGLSMYGTNAYNAVWERMCAEVFDNKLDKTLLELDFLKIPTKGSPEKDVDFTCDEKLIEVIKKPLWENSKRNIKYEAQKTLKPDTITVSYDKERCFIILDAKYYNLKLEKDTKLSGNPGVEDVTKQYLYQLAYKEFLEFIGIKKVKNYFLMPTEKNEIIPYGIAIMPIFKDLDLENIQIRLLPGELVENFYLSNKKIPIKELEEVKQ